MALLGIPLVFLALLLLQRLVYEHLWDRNLKVELDFSTNTAAEGGTVQLTEVIESRKALPLPWLTVKFQVSRHLSFPDGLHASVTDYYYREDLFSLGIYQRISRTLTVDLRKRGYYTFKSIDLISTDLLLTRKYVGHAQSGSVLTVTPRIIPRRDLEVPYRQLVGPVLLRSALLTDPFEFRTIREYQGFDTLKSINWLATARTGDLKVNVKEFTASCEVLVLLNVESDGPFPDDQLMEETVRIAASLCEYLVEDGIACGMVTNALDVMTGEPVEIPAGQSVQHVHHVMEQLGRLDLSKKPVDFTRILAGVHRDWNHEPVLALVSANCADALSRAWTDSLDQGFQGIWILPEYDDGKGRTPRTPSPIFRWEVKRHVG